MKLIRLISLLLAAMALASCGGASGDSEPKTDEAVSKPSEVIWRQGHPVVIANHSPWPKEAVVKDLGVGSGAVLRKGRTATLRYGNYDYRTGQRYYKWRTEPIVTGLGQGEPLAIWKAELEGMRVGGRREIIVPARYVYGHVPMVYVLELVALR